MTRRAAGAGLLTALALITTQGELLVKKSRGSWSQSAKSYELFRRAFGRAQFSDSGSVSRYTRNMVSTSRPLGSL